MPSRIIREGIISSPRINALSIGAELLYRRLMSVADDFGRFFGSVMNLRVSCFPTNPERFREKEVSKWLNELLRGDDPLVKTYSLEGITYLEIQSFGQQIRGKSKFPPPPWFGNQQDTHDSAKQMISEPVSKCEADVQPSRSRISEAESYTEASNTQAPQTGALVAVPSRRPKKPNRTIEEIETALGDRKEWWGWFWKVYPCHEGKRDAMDAYERIVTSHDLAAEIYKGAQRYAGKVMTDPTIRVKWAQGWLNAQRWKDEIDARASPLPPRGRDLVANVSREIQESLLKGEQPW